MALRPLVYKMFMKPMKLPSSLFKLAPVVFNNLTEPQHSLVSSGYKQLIVPYKSQATVTRNTGFDEAKAKIVLSLNLQSSEDALPFYKLPIKTLIHIFKTTQNDEKKGYCKNRLYYISSRIEVPPSQLSEKIAKRVFIYGLSFEWIKRALDVLLEMGVTSDRIVRDLWVLKYHHETIHQRLQAVKDMGIENLYPWMVRCSENILKRFISISQETKHILGESKSTHIYLANRLNTSLNVVEGMCIKMPALKTIRVTKVKHFLDFLINEGFDVEDIVHKPRVLSASQKTVKERIEILRKLGVNEINLNVLCRSKKGFKRYCDSLENICQESKDVVTPPS